MKASRASRFQSVSLSLLLLAVAVSIGFLASTPPISRDALTHHLAVPKLYLEAGGMVEMPDIPFSYYPMNVDILYILPLYFGNDILPKYIHFLFALLTAWGIGSYLKERFDIRYGLLGAVLFLSTPVVVKLASTAYVDLGLCCFAFFSLRYLLKWAQNGYRTRHLLIAGGMCGLALGTKYNALVIFLILTLLVPWLRKRYPATASGVVQNSSGNEGDAVPKDDSIEHRFLPPILATIVFAVMSMAVFSPWMIRNAVWTGNPVYPLYNQVFNAANQSKPETLEISPIPKANSSMLPLLTRKLVFKEPFWYTALIPLRIFWEGRDDNPRYFDGKLNPFFLLLSVIPFIAWRRRAIPERRDDFIWLCFTVLLILFTFFTSAMRIRYLIAIVPALVILSVSGLHCLMTAARRNYADRHVLAASVQCAAMAVVVAMMAYNAGYIRQLYQKYEPLSYVTGERDRAQYIGKYRPEYVVYSYANQNLDKNDIILGLYLGNRRYYSNIPLNMTQSIFWKALRAADVPGDITKRLSEKGITHLMMHHGLFKFWVEKGLNPSEIKILNAFLTTSLVELKRNGNYSLYKIVPRDN